MMNFLSRVLRKPKEAPPPIEPEDLPEVKAALHCRRIAEESAAMNKELTGVLLRRLGIPMEQHLEEISRALTIEGKKEP